MSAGATCDALPRLAPILQLRLAPRSRNRCCCLVAEKVGNYPCKDISLKLESIAKSCGLAYFSKMAKVLDRTLHFFRSVRADCSVPCYRSFAFAAVRPSRTRVHCPSSLPPLLPIALTCAPRGSVQHDCGRGCGRLLRQVIVCLRMSGVTHLRTII